MIHDYSYRYVLFFFCLFFLLIGFFPRVVFAEIYVGSIKINDGLGGNCYLAGEWNADTKTCTLKKDIQGSIEVSLSGATLDGNGHSLTVGPTPSIVGIRPSGSFVTIKNFSLIRVGSYGVYLSGSGNNKIINNIFSGTYCGIMINASKNNLVDGNTFISNGSRGIQIYKSSNNVITNNLISKGHFGIELEFSSNNIVTNNTIEDNRSYGLYEQDLSTSWDYIVNNNFINNGDGQTNWHNVSQMSDALPIGGNYWSNYDESKEGCDDKNGDYICDKPIYFNTFQKIYGDFLPWTTRDGWKGVREPDQFFAQLSNAPDGIHVMRESPSIDSLEIKQFPNNWIIKVINKKNTSRENIVSDEYLWYEVEDLSDHSTGWIPSAKVTESGIIDKVYIVYEAEKQTEYENLSSLMLETREIRANKIIEIINHYYDDIGVNKSLYSSNDGTLNLSLFKDIGFPKELLFSIIAQESGTIDFNNDFVSYDYGHGIMQVTFQAWFNEPLKFLKNVWDNRGKNSRLKMPICKSVIIGTDGKYLSGTDQYKKCYKNTETQNKYIKPYKNYNNDLSAPVYKQYTNTEQSIYGNIKDGLGSLREKYSKKCPRDSVVISGQAFSCSDIEKILMVWGYNGFGYDKTTGKYIGDYLKSISYRLENLPKYFPGQIYNNNDQLIQKLRIANDNRKVIKVFSPVELQIYDPYGNKTGLFSDHVSEQIPYSSYLYDQEGVVVLFPDPNLKFKVVGKLNDTYGILIDSIENAEQSIFSGEELEIHNGEVHTYTIDQKTLVTGGKGVHIDIDTNGDGTIERSLSVGREVFDLTPPDIDITLSKDEFILGESLVPKISVTDNKDENVSVQSYLNDVLVTGFPSILNKPGENILKVVATDITGNIQVEEKRFNVRYIFNGFLQPTVDNNILRGSRVIPVVFTVSDFFNNKIFGHGFNVIIRGEGLEEYYKTREEGESGRYEALVELKELNSGLYSIIAVLDDNTEHLVTINVKK